MKAQAATAEWAWVHLESTRHAFCPASTEQDCSRPCCYASASGTLLLIQQLVVVGGSILDALVQFQPVRNLADLCIRLLKCLVCVVTSLKSAKIACCCVATLLNAGSDDSGANASL